MNRRRFLRSIPLPLLIPAATSASVGDDNSIGYHAKELLRLLQEQLPEGCDIAASITSSGHVCGRAARRVWKADERLKGGGLWVEESAGEVWLFASPIA